MVSKTIFNLFLSGDSLNILRFDYLIFPVWGCFTLARDCRVMYLLATSLSSFYSARTASINLTMAFLLGKMPTTSVRRLTPRLRRSWGLLGQIWGQCSAGKADAALADHPKQDPLGSTPGGKNQPGK